MKIWAGAMAWAFTVGVIFYQAFKLIVSLS